MQNQKQESPTGEKNYNNKTKKDKIIILSDFIRQTRELLFYSHNAIYLRKNTSTLYAAKG
jgi:hypothetical protein